MGTSVASCNKILPHLPNMKVLVFVCLLAVSLAEPEADPQLLLTHPLTYSYPILKSVKAEDAPAAALPLPLTYSYPLLTTALKAQEGTPAATLPLTYTYPYSFPFSYPFGYPLVVKAPEAEAPA